ncbi:MAG: hypothetical protein ACUVQ1_02360 [Candidatus Kapaibacteriales bacterium]
MNNCIKSTSIIFTFAVIFVSILITSCECPLEEVSPTPICNVREVTITKFNPNGTLQNVQNPDGTTSLVFTPDSTYSIHTFQFPFDKNSSGLLPNDERFTKSSSITLVKHPFSDNRPYFLVILDNYPLNNDLNGDILVYDVSVDLSSAELRIAGSINRLGEKFNSENSQEFCEFVNNLVKDKNKINQYKNDLKPFGFGLPFANVINYNISKITILDKDNNPVAPGTVVPLQEDIDQILKLTENKAVNITVRVGDVFIYQALNGKYFIFAITDIRQGTLSPNKRRVTIMFSEIN